MLSSLCVYVTILIVLCRSRKHEVEEGVLEMLLSLTDFLAFKQMFLDYKEVVHNSHTQASSMVRGWQLCLSLYRTRKERELILVASQ